MDTQLNETWDKVLKILKVEIMSEVSYNTWILGLKPIGIKNGVFMIDVPNELTLDIITQRYKLLFKEAIKHVLNQEINVECVVGGLVKEKDEELSSIKEEKKNTTQNTDTYGI